jgi:hypothetical protein
VHARENSRRQNTSLIVSAMEAECRHYLHTHNRIPPKRRKIPVHSGLRQFMICDATVLLDSAGAPASDTLGAILCLHPHPQRMETVVVSLFERPLPHVADVDAYEPPPEHEEDEMTLEEMYDDEDDGDDMVGNDDGDLMVDIELLAINIDNDELVRATGPTVHTRKWPFHAFFTLIRKYNSCHLSALSHFRVCTVTASHSVDDGIGDEMIRLELDQDEWQMNGDSDDDADLLDDLDEL